ncbi:MAG: shikimate kinase [Chitinophagales bacterium]|nr:MAG: shikimate kinase [Chitinophagales bacterium]
MKKAEKIVRKRKMEVSRIFLIGPMGCGKTWWGQRLASLMGWQFIDLDFFIEDTYQMSIPDIFGKYGEECFRQMEYDSLQKVASLDKVVVATGGGTPCFFDNMKKMNTWGETCYLRVSVPVLVQRLADNTSGRPLLQGKSRHELADFLARQLKEREKYYLKATHVVDEELLDEQQLLGLFVTTSTYER